METKIYRFLSPSLLLSFSVSPSQSLYALFLFSSCPPCPFAIRILLFVLPLPFSLSSLFFVALRCNAEVFQSWMISVAFLFRRRAAAPPPPPLLLPLPHCPPLPFSSMPWVRPEWSFYTKRFSTNCTSVFKVNALGIEKVIYSQARVRRSLFLLIIIIIVEFSQNDNNSGLLRRRSIYFRNWHIYLYLRPHLISTYYWSFISKLKYFSFRSLLLCH